MENTIKVGDKFKLKFNNYGGEYIVEVININLWMEPDMRYCVEITNEDNPLYGGVAHTSETVLLSSERIIN